MESDRETGKARIDPKLKSSGWSVVPAVVARPISSAVAIEEYPTDLGPADYVLADRAEPLGVVEAKKLTVGPQGVLAQAERYAAAIPGNKWQATLDDRGCRIWNDDYEDEATWLAGILLVPERPRSRLHVEK